MCTQERLIFVSVEDRILFDASAVHVFKPLVPLDFIL